MSCLAIWLLTPFIIVLGVIYWLTETPEQRCRRWRCAGMTQKGIAQQLGVSTYRVRAWLA